MTIEGQLHWLRIACRSICIARLDLNDMVVVEVFRGHLGLVLQLQRVRSAQLHQLCVGKSVFPAVVVAVAKANRSR